MDKIHPEKPEKCRVVHKMTPVIHQYSWKPDPESTQIGTFPGFIPIIHSPGRIAGGDRFLEKLSTKLSTFYSSLRNRNHLFSGLFFLAIAAFFAKSA